MKAIRYFSSMYITKPLQPLDLFVNALDNLAIRLKKMPRQNICAQLLQDELRFGHIQCLVVFLQP